MRTADVLLGSHAGLEGPQVERVEPLRVCSLSLISMSRTLKVPDFQLEYLMGEIML